MHVSLAEPEEEKVKKTNGSETGNAVLVLELNDVHGDETGGNECEPGCALAEVHRHHHHHHPVEACSCFLIR